MTTLITGATGFLGTHLVDELLRRGEKDLRVLAQKGAPGLAERGVAVVSGSVTSPADAARAVAGVERIYHLAGFVSRKRDDAHRMYAVHVEGTRVLCEAARTAGCKRIVVASTSGTVAVSERADELPDETCPAPIDIIARWPYYASKLYQEEAARRACGDALELVLVNPSLLLGPGDDRLSSTRDVLSFLARDIQMTPPGGLNFVDARDVAAVLPAAMERGRAGERYLLGGYNWTFSEFFGRLERLTKVAGPLLKARGKWTVLAAHAQAAVMRKLGRTPPVDPEAVEMARYYWYFDSTKARDELGFSVREATETLHDTVKYLRANFLGNGALAAG
ncbi:MAG TPA: NAD-dependent epimerase/dehydratase family protein [Polyangia bacterium]|nr:NAD-dependent epimerase/dehydratase family protein [Polyangia bacterium]